MARQPNKRSGICPSSGLLSKRANVWIGFETAPDGCEQGIQRLRAFVLAQEASYHASFGKCEYSPLIRRFFRAGACHIKVVRRSCDGNAPTEVFSDDIAGGKPGIAELVAKPFGECFTVDPGIRRRVLAGDDHKSRRLEFQKWALSHDV
jgi:hypothetical protein